MAILMDDYIAKLPKERQEKIKVRAAELLAEEATLQELRKSFECSQEKIAKKLHIKQAAVSKIEHKTDMYVSTLRSFIEAMGGSLEIIAKFPNAKPVKINQFEGLSVQ